MKNLYMCVGLLVCLGLSGCLSKHVVRDRQAWETEAAFVNNLVKAEQRAIESLMKRSCTCTNVDETLKWIDTDCEDAAETLVVVRARWAWHYQMMLFNAGVAETQPGQEPVIPANTALCEEMNNAQ